MAIKNRFARCLVSVTITEYCSPTLGESNLIQVMHCELLLGLRHPFEVLQSWEGKAKFTYCLLLLIWSSMLKTIYRERLICPPWYSICVTEEGLK